jgi:DNA polymerase III epsilon subunit-like protein
MTEKVSMQHWNGNQMCAIDVETTGKDPSYHEIVQICILPLDINLKPRKDVLPFNIYLVPDFPERVDKASTRCHGKRLSYIMKRGFERIAAIDMMRDWIDKLGLPFTKSKAQRRCKIIPLAHNYVFDIGFIKAWLGNEQYNEWFFGHFRDTMQIALYLNDHSAQHAETVPYSKVGLGWLANQFNIEHDQLHDALVDCRVTAEVYKAMLDKGLFV